MEHLGDIGDENSYPVILRDYRINHEIRIPIDQPGFHEMSQVSFFLAHVRYFPGTLNYQTSSFDMNIWEVGRFSLGVTQPAIC